MRVAFDCDGTLLAYDGKLRDDMCRLPRVKSAKKLEAEYLARQAALGGSMKNPNAIWFQTQDNLFAQVMRIGGGRGGVYYRFEVYSVFTYPRWYARPKSGQILLKGGADSLPNAKNEVFKELSKRAAQ